MKRLVLAGAGHAHAAKPERRNSKTLWSQRAALHDHLPDYVASVTRGLRQAKASSVEKPYQGSFT